MRRLIVLIEFNERNLLKVNLKLEKFQSKFKLRPSYPAVARHSASE